MDSSVPPPSVHPRHWQDSPNSFQLLKLHGSVNWRPKLGHSGPVAVDAITHHHDWSGLMTHSPDIAGQIAGQLEPESVIVPPVLTKTSLAEQPVLRNRLVERFLLPPKRPRSHLPGLLLPLNGHRLPHAVHRSAPGSSTQSHPRCQSRGDR